jgi:hypothetical protein
MDPSFESKPGGLRSMMKQEGEDLLRRFGANPSRRNRSPSEPSTARGRMRRSVSKRLSLKNVRARWPRPYRKSNCYGDRLYAAEAAELMAVWMICSISGASRTSFSSRASARAFNAFMLFLIRVVARS